MVTNLPLWMKGLTPEMVRIAEVTLRETPEAKEKGLIKLKKFIEDEDGFYPLMDETFLLRFLRCKKYDVKRAFKTMKNYYWYKATYSGTATDLTPVEIKPIYELNTVMVSPKRSPVGGGILIMYPGLYDLDLFPLERFIASGIISAEIGMETEASQVCGSSIVFDLRDITWRMTKAYSSPSFLGMVIRGVQDCWPYRLNSIHFTNEPSYFSWTWACIRPMLSKKLRDRVHFHGTDFSGLHAILPPETLPENLGGHLGEKDFAEFRKMMLQNNAMVERMNKYTYQGVDSETKRLSSSKKEDPDETTLTLFNITI